MPDGTAPVAITTQGDCKAGAQGRYKTLFMLDGSEEIKA